MAPQRRETDEESVDTLRSNHAAQDMHQPDMNMDEKAVDTAVPDGGYGWVVVACVVLINMHSWGLNSSYGVFIAHFVNTNTYPDARDLDFSYIAGLSVSVALVLAPVSTFCVRKLGTKFTLVLGCVFETLALITASFTTEIWQLYLSQGLCFGVGLGFLYISSVGLIPQWFAKNRSFATAIGAGGSGLGGLVYNLASQAVIQRAGFRWAYRMIGICAFVVTLVCAFLAKDRNKAIGANVRMADFTMFKRKEFNFVQLWGWFSLLGYFVLVYSLPSYATSVGLSASQGSVVGAILNLGQTVGRPFVGLVSDKVGRINISASLSALCGILCLVWWTFADSFGVLVAFALVAGFFSGTYWAAIAPVGAEVVGLRDLPILLSMTWVIVAPPTAFSDVISNEIETNTRYLYAQIYTGLCYIVAGICLWVVRVWKIGQLEQIAAREKASVDAMAPAPSPKMAAEDGESLSRYPKSGVLKRVIMWKKV